MNPHLSRLLVWVLLSSALTSAAYGQSLLSGDEFDAYTVGKTFLFGHKDQDVYGAEHYLPDRKILWSNLDGSCDTGSWFDNNGQTCFFYEHSPYFQCWNFYLKDGELTAEFLGVTSGSPFYTVTETTEDLTCTP